MLLILKDLNFSLLLDYQFCIFLQCLDYSIELTKTTIDKYFTLRTLHPEVFQSLPKDVFISTSKIL